MTIKCYNKMGTTKILGYMFYLMKLLRSSFSSQKRGLLLWRSTNTNTSACGETRPVLTTCWNVYLSIFGDVFQILPACYWPSHARFWQSKLPFNSTCCMFSLVAGCVTCCQADCLFLRYWYLVTSQAKRLKIILRISHGMWAWGFIQSTNDAKPLQSTYFPSYYWVWRQSNTLLPDLFPQQV